jgi:tetratricopeptide (TPR) repeat protein
MSIRVNGIVKSATEPINSANTDLYFNFGIAYKNFKKLEIAKKYLKLAIKLNPSKELYYFVLGGIHQQMNEFIDAKENFKQAIKIEPLNVAFNINYANLIKNEFKFKDKIESSNPHTLSLLTNIRESNSVMINVRRADYLNTDFHGVFGMDYINSAVKIVESKVENPKYFIFSDDIEWCIENIDLPNMTIVNHSYKGPKFSHYLQLMMNCKHFIIPNSSFAWWSACLNQNTDKIVIAPKRWFNRDDINTIDLIPDNWLRI